MELLHGLSLSLMVGIIWLVQLVHYPSFHWITTSRFQAYHHFHSTRISILVGPLMLIQLISAVGLTWKERLWWPTLGFSLVVCLLTIFVSIPLHEQLTKGYDAKITTKLIRTNWFRTATWTLHLIWFTEVMTRSR